MTPLENWSRDYVMAPTVDVDRHGGDLALIDDDLYDELVYALGRPVIGYIGGLHYHLKPSRAVLADRVAVPRSNHRASGSLTLLLAK